MNNSVNTTIACSLVEKKRIFAKASLEGLPVVQFINICLNDFPPTKKISIFKLTEKRDVSISVQIPLEIYKKVQVLKKELSNVARRLKTYEIILSVVLMVCENQPAALDE